MLILAACGGDSEELTCALLDDPANCWAQTAVALSACMPARATPAVMSADRTSCTFADGVVAVFDEPLGTTAAEFANGFAFTIENCARYTTNLDDRQTLVVGDDTVTVELRGGDVHLACGGDDFVAPLDTAFACPHPPTLALRLDAPAIHFFVSSAATDGDLFSCAP